MTVSTLRPLVLLLLLSCALERPRARAATPSDVDVGERLATVRANGDDTVAAIRPALLDAVTMADWVSLAIDQAPPLLVETANSRAIDELATLIDVDVSAGGVRVGTEQPCPSEAVEEKARTFVASPSAVFLVRGHDDARASALANTVVAIKRAGAAHVILGATTLERPLAKWNGCPFPAGRRDAEADVRAVVDFDDTMRAGVVHVASSPRARFASAAALCLVRHRFEPKNPDVRGKSYTFAIHFRQP